MTPERWQQIQNLFDRVRNVQSNERAAFLQQACTGDEELRREVEWMLTHQNVAEHFMRTPALDVAAISLAADAGTSLVGSALGPYQDLELIGAGGMGEVYSARDIRLDRRVAIKRLHGAFVNDRERIARLEREAKLLAALNHPNIAAIYELDECDGLQYLVMELVPGLTLAERLSAGPMKCEEALRIGVQIAEALEAAHEKAIIHRDLKPANIKITAEGNVKVLDFGLAKVFSDGAANINLPRSAPMTNGGTQRGSILGTPAYMSPEQAQGKTLDRRTDIWSFGVVLYEMLTGRMPFSGETVSETMAAVMMKEPDWNMLPANLPARVRGLLRRCLMKEPRNRLRDIGDARIAIEEVQSGAEVGPDVPQTPSSRRSKVLGGSAAVLFLATILSLGALSVMYLQPAASAT